MINKSRTHIVRPYKLAFLANQAQEFKNEPAQRILLREHVRDSYNSCGSFGSGMSAQGYSMLELLLAVVVGSIILAASYASYVNLSKQYNRIAAISEIHNTGIATLNFISRDIRMAGYEAVNNEMLAIMPSITTPIEIVDSGDSCCDSITITYDKDINTRYRKTYYVTGRTDPIRDALYLDLEISNDGTSWELLSEQSLIADYIEDFQVAGSDLDTSLNPRLVDISMVFRNKNQLTKTYNYSKSDYNVGNYSLAAEDKYIRDVFYATLNIRNLR